jgi:protein HOOK3
LSESLGKRRDDHYYRIQSERSAIYSEKETLEKVYQALLEEHRTLQTSYDDALSEKEDVLAQLRQSKRDTETRRNEKADVMMRTEMDRLRIDLYVLSRTHKSEAHGGPGRRAKIILLWPSQN